MIQVGSTVQYFTTRTQDRKTGVRKETPDPIGPLAALVTAMRGETVNLIVFLPSGRNYPAFDVTREPSTPVCHYWQPLKIEGA